MDVRCNGSNRRQGISLLTDPGDGDMHVKHCLAALVVLLAGGPAFAAGVSYVPPHNSALYSSASITGDVTAGLGWLSISSVSSGAATLGGRMNIPLHNGWNLEPDVGFATVFSPSVSVIGAVAHFYKKMPEVAFGVFGGGYSTSASSSTTALVIGAEVAVYSHPNSIFGAQVSFNSVSSGTSFPDVAGYWDYFFTPDVKATAGIEWLGGTTSTTIGTLALTKRWTGTQWSGFVSGSIANGGGVTGYLGLVGITWNFDPPGTTQYDHDRAIPFKFATTLF